MNSNRIHSAILQHSIKLNAGRGGYIFDNRDLFLRGELRPVLFDAALKLWDRISYLNPDVLITKGLGGIPLALAMASFSHVNVLIVREARKVDGLRRLVEGPAPDALPAGTRAVFIDDILNTGATYREAIEAVETEGYQLNVVGVATLIDFWAGSRALRITGTPVEALYKRHDFGITRTDAEVSLKLKIAWHVPHLNNDVGLDIKSWPRIGYGDLFVGSDDGNFHCFDTFYGTRLWTHYSERPQRKGNVCVPAFFNSHVIISSYDGTVRALDRRTGEPAWQTKVDRNLHSSPKVYLDTVYVGTEYDKHGGGTPREWNGRGDIVALNANTGEEKWRTHTDGMVPCTPFYDFQSHQVICASNDFHVYVLNPDNGQVLQKIPTRGEVKGLPIVMSGARLFTLSVQGWLQCFWLADGELLWERDLGGSIHAWPITYKSYIYVVTNKGMGVCFDYTGTVRWMVRLRGPVGWGFSWLAGRLAALTTSGHLVTIDPETGIRLTSNDLSELPEMQGVRTFQPVLDNTGHLSRMFIATNNRGLIALDY